MTGLSAKDAVHRVHRMRLLQYLSRQQVRLQVPVVCGLVHNAELKTTGLSVKDAVHRVHRIQLLPGHGRRQVPLQALAVCGLVKSAGQKMTAASVKAVVLRVLPEQYGIQVQLFLYVRAAALI